MKPSSYSVANFGFFAKKKISEVNRYLEHEIIIMITSISKHSKWYIELGTLRQSKKRTVVINFTDFFVSFQFIIILEVNFAIIKY